MPEQITLYRDTNNISPFSHRVEIALLEARASYTGHGINLGQSRPSWYAQVNQTGKVPAITYGGPDVPPEEPSPLSFKLTESSIILEFIADVFPDSHILPPVSNPTARARVRLFVDAIARNVEEPTFELMGGSSDVNAKIIEGLLKIQALLPDPDTTDSGEFAIGGEFTIADCAIAPILAFIEVVTRPDVGKYETGTWKTLEEALAGENFTRLRRYKKVLWERESVKKLLDLDRIGAGWKPVFGRN